HSREDFYHNTGSRSLHLFLIGDIRKPNLYRGKRHSGRDFDIRMLMDSREQCKLDKCGIRRFGLG
ncbi:MAG: hypothetical protein WCF58_17290, partial [Syntrophobacteraceae bacterium]